MVFLSTLFIGLPASKQPNEKRAKYDFFLRLLLALVPEHATFRWLSMPLAHALFRYIYFLYRIEFEV